jgi:GDP-L-fucose synthase
MIYGLSGKKIWVAGHRGMVGSALVRRLNAENCVLLTVDRSEVDLRNQAQVDGWVKTNRPDAVFLAAARVGGILANSNQPADFIYDNLMIESNVIHAAYKFGVEKLLFLGSSCIYPRLAEQPIVEGALLTGALEPTNEWYAIAKIAGIKLCQAYRTQHGCDFISAMPTNLYGPGDNYDLSTSHVIPALLRKAHSAKINKDKSFEIWGSGTPRREFLHVDDLAGALVHMIKHYSSDEHLNIGCGSDLSIHELALIISSVVGFGGNITFDRTKPDGTPRKLLDVSRVTQLGWQPLISIERGLHDVYKNVLANNLI